MVSIVINAIINAASFIGAKHITKLVGVFEEMEVDPSYIEFIKLYKEMKELEDEGSEDEDEGSEDE